MKYVLRWLAVGCVSASPLLAQNGWGFLDMLSPQPAGSWRMPDDTSAAITGGGEGIGGTDYDNPGTPGDRHDPMVHITGVGDQFGFMARSPAQPDGELVVRLASLDGPAGAQAAILVRGPRSYGGGSGSSPSALSQALIYRQGQDLAVLTRRDDTGAVIGFSGVPGGTVIRVLESTPPALPLWLRVQHTRGGALFSTSTNGVDWTLRTWETLKTTYDQLGLGVSSGTQGVAATAAFDHIRVGPLTTPIAAPVTPANFRVTAITSSEIKFGWEVDPVGIDDFELERSIGGGPFERVVEFNSRLLHSDRTVVGGTTYTYRVRFVRGPAFSAWSPTLAVTTPFIAAPSNLVADMSVPNQVTLHWNDNSSDETGFDIEYRFDGTPFYRLAAANATEATIMSPGYDPIMYFRVRSRKADAVSTFSNEVRVNFGASPTGAPSITYSPEAQTLWMGQSTRFAVSAATAGSATYTWEENGKLLTDAHDSTLTLTNLQPGDTGVYQAVVSDSSGVARSPFALLTLDTVAKLTGTGSEVGSDIRHPNGNVYDQVLMTGPALSVTANPGQILRISYVDLSDDIVQVEFAGAGTLSITLDSPSGPMPAVNYRQPNVAYMKGHAGIVISGANDTTNISVFAVGRATAIDQSIFRDDVRYEGVADLAYIAIKGGGFFGGVRAANASFWSTRGVTGIYAPDTTFTALYVCDITATENATPVLWGGYSTDVRIAGGDLLQTNGRSVVLGTLSQLKFTDGTTANNERLPAQRNRARFVDQWGQDVTDRITIQQP